MASRSAALTGGDSTLVRHFQPINWNFGRAPRRLVRHLVDDLGNHPGRDRRGMNKVIEADFLPLGPNRSFFLVGSNRWLGKESKKAHPDCR